MSRNIAVFGKNGSGSTTVAANIACALSARDKICIIIPANMQYGEIQVFFNAEIKEDRGLLKALTDPTEQENQMLTPCSEVSNNIFILGVPNKINEYISVPRFEIKKVEDLVRKLNAKVDYVIFDCVEDVTNQMTAMALYLADHVLLTYRPSHDSILWHQATHSILNQLKLTDRIIPIITKANMGCTLEQFYTETKMSYRMELPYIEDATIYQNAGKPIYMQKSTRQIKEYRATLDLIVQKLETNNESKQITAENPSGEIELDTLIYLKNKQSTQVKEIQNYETIKETISQIINQRHSNELAEVVDKPEAANRLKTLIRTYLNAEKLVRSEDIGQLTQRIYDDMAGLGLVTQFLSDPELEELNINETGSIWAQYPGKKVRIEKKFANAVEAEAIIKKMIQIGGVVIDGSAPIGDSSIGNGKRVSGAITPCARENTGGIASIRKQKRDSVTLEALIANGTASKEEITFIESCINNETSVIFSGATGSGKTASMGCVLQSIPDDVRVGVIQDNDEIDLRKYNEHNEIINDRFHLLTKDAPNPVDEQALTKLMLRLDPDVITLAEMRGKEAADIVRGANTGHVAISSIHAKSGQLTYKRLMRLCHLAEPGLSEQSHLEDIIEAFPIVVFQKKLKDGSRKWMHIFEATGIKDGNVVGNMIFKFVQTSVDKDASGKIKKINGTHKRINPISPKLAELFKENCVEQALIDEWSSPGEKEDEDHDD